MSVLTPCSSLPCVIFLNQLALSGRIPVPAIAVSESSFTQPNSAVSQCINSQMRSPLYSNLRAKYHWITQLLAIQFNLFPTFFFFFVHCTLYIVHCTLCIVRCTLYIVPCLIWGHVTTWVVLRGQTRSDQLPTWFPSIESPEGSGSSLVGSLVFWDEP